ncbi:MAG TPA: Rid family hydrolase [Devosia sp.]|nr:Rid family hydrolase [Devosia sp.]
MTRTIIYTSDAPAPPPTYSQAVRANGFIFVSGTGPFDAATGAVTGDTIGEQTAQCFRNIPSILASQSRTLADVVSATFILWDEADFGGMNEEWAKWFPKDPPARQGAKLPIHLKGQRVSVAVIAAG